MTVAKRIIPCLDVNKGRVVKGINFKELKDAGDPVKLAKQYSDEGADELISFTTLPLFTSRQGMILFATAISNQFLDMFYFQLLVIQGFP